MEHLLYRLYTEDIPGTADIVSGKLDNFTIFHGTGYYEGGKENSLVIEYIGKPEDRPQVEALAQNIKTVNGQECVLMTIDTCSAEMI